MPGELYIGGDGVARGYLNRPALTAERFVPDPFGPPRGPALPDRRPLPAGGPTGSLEFLGRNDDQVKIRGYRIELGEVEAALAGLPGVREAAVVAPRGDARRPAAGRLRRPAAIDSTPTALKRRPRPSACPDYMVPSAIVALDALPLTPNGKVDRRALPAPEVGPGRPRPRRPAATRPRRRWRRLAATVLHVEAVGVHDNLFERGIDSILAIQ